MSLGSVERTESRHAAAFDVEIASVATAVPIHRIEQAAIVERSRLYYRQFGHMESLYSNVGIATRYFCEAMDWYTVPRGWEERTTSFQRHALDLLEQVSVEAITGERLKLGDALGGFLDREGMTLADFDGFLFHPGSSKVLDVVEGLSASDRRRSSRRGASCATSAICPRRRRSSS